MKAAGIPVLPIHVIDRKIYSNPEIIFPIKIPVITGVNSVADLDPDDWGRIRMTGAGSG
jgi:hypothetical protein